MSTKSQRSSGTQITKKGINQGVVLVDPVTGNPVNVVYEGGQYKLVVKGDGSGGGGGPTSDVNIVSSIPLTLKDQVTGNLLKVNPDGSIDVNMESDAADGDSMMAVGTENGTPSGIQHTLKIGSDGNARVKDDAAVTELQGINTKLSNPLPLPSGAATEATLANVLTELSQKTEPTDAQNIRNLSSVSDSVSVPGVATSAKQDSQITELNDINTKLANPLPLPTGAATATKQDEAKAVLQSIDSKLTNPLPISGSVTATVGDLNANKDDVAVAGTEDGTANGQVRHFVNNRRQQILAAHDRVQAITYADFGTKDERVTSIVYTSPTFPGVSAVKTITYTLISNRYRRDNITWSLV